MSEKHLAGTEIPGPDDYLESVFGRKGYLADKFDGYAVRRGQVALADAVDSAIRQIDGKRHLLAEGPTGTGKSIAYLVPATYWAARQGETIVIATANIALQEQLVEKDLPLLREILPWNFSFALLKGLNNYLCLDKVEEGQRQQELGQGDRRTGHGPPGEPDLTTSQGRASAIRMWAETTTTGDRNELPFQVGPEWGDFSVAAGDCRGKKCPEHYGCFGVNARVRAKGANVIVTNFALLFAHLAIRRMTGGVAGPLPPYQHLILDEAHKAADIARDFFGSSVSQSALNKAAGALYDRSDRQNSIPSGEVGMVQDTGSALFDDLRRMYQGNDYKTRLKAEGQIHKLNPPEPAPPGEDVFGEPLPPPARTFIKHAGKLSPVLAAIDGAKESVKATRREMKRHFSPDAPFDQMSKDEQALSKRYEELGRASARLSEQSAAMRKGNELKSKNEVHFLEENRDRTVKLSSRLVNVAHMLRDEMFDSTPGTVVLTSATLATGGSFSYLIKECGAPAGETSELIVDSPFDWMEQALMVVPSGLPAPNEKAFADAICENSMELIRRVKGRCLLLFTSYSKLRAVRDRLKYAGLPYQILVQGERPRSQLVAEFKRDISSVLLGTESFWAGVDVPGEALSAVMIDRIPFPTPDNPVLDAISATNDRWFFDYSVPKAAVQLSQGVGRLIRAVSDRGVVMILDKRIVEKSYGQYFLDGMPSMRKSRRLDSIDEFLGQPAEVDPFD